MKERTKERKNDLKSKLAHFCAQTRPDTGRTVTDNWEISKKSSHLLMSKQNFPSDYHQILTVCYQSCQTKFLEIILHSIKLFKCYQKSPKKPSWFSSCNHFDHQACYSFNTIQLASLPASQPFTFRLLVLRLASIGKKKAVYNFWFL